MVTCTAMAFVILQHGLQHARQRHAGQGRAQAKNIVAEDVDQHQPPLSMIEVSHGFEGVAGERGERSAETDDHQQSPMGIDENALCRPNEKEPNYEAANDVDEERAVGKDWAEFASRDAA